jgi:uncharacterized protein YkwD
MRRRDLRRVMLLLPFLVLLLLMGWVSGGTSLSPLDLTPTAYSHLPLAIAHPTPTATANQPTPTATTLAPPAIPPEDLEIERQVVDGLNAERAAQGLETLALVSELTQAARRHSRDMAENELTSHTGSDGSTPCQRMSEAGYDWIACAEIIGWGTVPNVEGMIDWWMNSPPHRGAILGDFEDLGVGYAKNLDATWKHYWSVSFGTRASRGAAGPETLYECTFTMQGPQGGSYLYIYSTHPCR